MSAVLTEFADGVAVITINRPEAKNAVNLEVSEGIAAAIDELESRDDLTIGIGVVAQVPGIVAMHPQLGVHVLE